MNNIIKLIKSLSDLSEVCDIFSDEITLENGEKIVEKIDECDLIYSELKEEIVKLIKCKSEENNDLENDLEDEENLKISGFNFGNGFLIKGDENG